MHKIAAYILQYKRTYLVNIVFVIVSFGAAQSARAQAPVPAAGESFGTALRAELAALSRSRLDQLSQLLADLEAYKISPTAVACAAGTRKACDRWLETIEAALVISQTKDMLTKTYAYRLIDRALRERVRLNEAQRPDDESASVAYFKAFFVRQALVEQFVASAQQRLIIILGPRFVTLGPDPSFEAIACRLDLIKTGALAEYELVGEALVP